MGTCFSNDEKLERRDEGRGVNNRDNSLIIDYHPPRERKEEKSEMILTRLVEAEIEKDKERTQEYMKDLQEKVLKGSQRDQDYLIRGLEEIGYGVKAEEIRKILLRPLGKNRASPSMPSISSINQIFTPTTHDEEKEVLIDSIQGEFDELPLDFDLEIEAMFNERTSNIVGERTSNIVGERTSNIVGERNTNIVDIEDIINKYVQLESIKEEEEEIAPLTPRPLLDLSANIYSPQGIQQPPTLNTQWKII